MSASVSLLSPDLSWLGSSRKRLGPGEEIQLQSEIFDVQALSYLLIRKAAHTRG